MLSPMSRTVLAPFALALACTAPPPATAPTPAAAGQEVASVETVREVAPVATPPAATGLAAPEPDGPPAPLVDAPMTTPCATVGYVAPTGARPALRHRTRGNVLEIGLHNEGTAPVCMYTHIATHELQHDWLKVTYADGERHHYAPRQLEFYDDRDQSAPVSREIGPGETVWIGLDLAAWALRKVNGGEPLTRGSLYVTAIYDTSSEDRVWRGRLERVFGMNVP